MEIVILPSADDVGRTAARIVAELILRNPRAVLGLATGATQEPVYAELGRLHAVDGIDFSQITTFNLDEYVGLAPGHPGSFHHYMCERFLNRVNVSRERVHLPDGMASDVSLACAEYEGAIRAAGGIDLQLLGIGLDGHIGFNEPTSSLASRTRLKTLTPATMAGVSAQLGKDAPRHAITMGIATILDARRCLLLACGRHKATAIARAVEGPVSAFVPASALQLHPRATVLLDEDAASGLALADYYREVHRNKPDFQRDEDGV
jgi:glucosamine-6-phosphate deaminase